jgi:alpha,alpha-trehalase
MCRECILSSLNTPHPFVVPGGRFREFYYWDTFWIIKGLIVSEMCPTIKGMLLNMIEAIKNFGFVPNGFRIYYLNRSQPPLLVQMVESYISKCNDPSFLAENLKYLDMEYEFWMKYRAIKVKNHTINLYKVVNDYPRPESFIEDVFAARSISNMTDDHSHYYSNIASGGKNCNMFLFQLNLDGTFLLDG